MVADVAQCLSNAVILSGIVRLAQGTPIRRFVLGMLGTSGPTYIGYGVIGFLFVILWVPGGVGPASALLILAPLFVARWAFVQYGDEQRAHERTLSALAAAVETKDLYTRGHSERVALLCGLIAGSLSMSHQDTEVLRFAGMLHDIGKLAIPTRVLRRADGLSDADLATIATHPARGVEMVRDIEFLEGSMEAILHHHERMDGRGYPSGLRGEDIPLFARVVAVADAFDSVTTSRSHRDAHTVEEAVAELHRRAGAQFDPTIVAALERGLVRHVWEPTRLEPGLMATAGRAFDHDDPAASDLMAGLAISEPAGSGSDGLGPLRARETAP
jgi:putative nucleotidyltransferase with HDIG domain